MSDVFEVIVEHDGKSVTTNAYGHDALDAVHNAIPRLLVKLDRVEELKISARRTANITGQRD